MDQAMELRKSVLEGEHCSFHAEITADYTDIIYTFQMDCITDSSGKLQFTVTEPESIAGITGHISSDRASLTFDDKILAFPMLSDNQLTPVSAPWIFIQTLRSGYLTGCSKDNAHTYLYIDDSYEDYPLHLEIMVDADMVPKYAEIIWNNRRILSLRITDFLIQ